MSKSFWDKEVILQGIGEGFINFSIIRCFFLQKTVQVSRIPERENMSREEFFTEIKCLVEIIFYEEI